jgi:hypothetical protein
MHRLKVMLAFLLLASCGVSLASAAGTGTFSIQQATPSVGVGQFGIATLVMDNTWTPPADSVTLTLKWDPAIIQYVSTDWKVGHSVDATPSGTDTLVINFADFTNKYPTGRVSVADINFKGLQAGQSTMSITVGSVRSHAGVSETEFTDLTAAALTNPGTFTVGQGGGAVTTLPTVPIGTTLTVIPTLTTGPIVTGNVTGTITTPIMIPTSLPTTGITTGITTGAPFVPVQGSSGGGSEDYTGVLTRTPTVTATKTATSTATVTATATSGAGAGNATVTTTATPVVTVTAGVVNVTATRTALATTPAGTTTARTTVPVNTTATRSGADMLPLAAAGLAALALIAARRR